MVADYHPSKPVGARHFPTDLLPLASVKASLQCLWREIVGLCFRLSEGEAGNEREELIAYNACGVCLCALVCALCVVSGRGGFIRCARLRHVGSCVVFGNKRSKI